MLWKEDEVCTEKMQRNYEQNDDMELSPVLGENDFMKMINLQQKYNYYKCLIKILTHNNLNDSKSETNMVKVMVELIEYYSQCISQAQANIDNVVKYFQNKMKEVNGQYKQITDKQKEQQHQKLVMQRTVKKQLGGINLTNQIKIPQIEGKGEPEDQKIITFKDHKVNIRNSLMNIMQSQDIEGHIAEADKKADLLKKSVAATLKEQQQNLDRRRNEAKIKRQQSRKKNKSFAHTQSSNTATTSMKTTPKRKQITPPYSNGNSIFKDEIQYIQGFQIDAFVLNKLQEVKTKSRLKNK